MTKKDQYIAKLQQRLDELIAELAKLEAKSQEDYFERLQTGKNRVSPS